MSIDIESRILAGVGANNALLEEIKALLSKTPMEQSEQNMEAFDGLLTTLEDGEEGETND